MCNELVHLSKRDIPDARCGVVAPKYLMDEDEFEVTVERANERQRCGPCSFFLEVEESE